MTCAIAIESANYFLKINPSFKKLYGSNITSLIEETKQSKNPERLIKYVSQASELEELTAKKDRLEIELAETKQKIKELAGKIF